MARGEIVTQATCSIGYCTNVHAGVNLDSIRKNLDQHAVAARIASRSDELGVGLWLPAEAASQIATEADSFASFLQERHLRPFTINGFPYANFHEPVVKHRVYQPAWWQRERLDYVS